MLRIKTFKAIDDPITSLKFANGHSDVLASYGIPKVTSSDTRWMENPDVYVIIVESYDGAEVFGGARLHVLGETDLLPIEDAIGEIDARIYSLTRSYRLGKTGELCGLWNARKMSGLGLSSLLIRVGVAKCGIALAKHLNLESLFALCAPWTVQMCIERGFKVEVGVGNNGELSYPKDDLVATVMKIDDIERLKLASEMEKDRIYKLRLEPVQVRTEESTRGKLAIEYNLLF